MKKVLLKDIVIPKGTIFNDAPVKTVRTPGEYVECVVGVTDDTAGFFTYEVSEDLDDWFCDVRE